MFYFREDAEAQEYLQEVYERLDELGADTAESKASHILLGLQFDAKMQAKKCKDFSGKSSIYWQGLSYSPKKSRRMK